MPVGGRVDPSVDLFVETKDGPESLKLCIVRLRCYCQGWQSWLSRPGSRCHRKQSHEHPRR